MRRSDASSARRPGRQAGPGGRPVLGDQVHQRRAHQRPGAGGQRLPRGGRGPQGAAALPVRAAGAAPQVSAGAALASRRGPHLCGQCDLWPRDAAVPDPPLATLRPPRDPGLQGDVSCPPHTHTPVTLPLHVMTSPIKRSGAVPDATARGLGHGWSQSGGCKPKVEAPADSPSGEDPPVGSGQRLLLCPRLGGEGRWSRQGLQPPDLVTSLRPHHTSR